MKRFIIISIVFIFILVIAIIGSVLVTPNNEVEIISDIMEVQKKLEADYSCYGYTIDNPKIVVNPYKVNPLSALIMFETKDKEKIDVYLYDNNGNKYKFYSEDSEKKEHYLDIYGLVSNKVIIVGKKEYEYKIDAKLDDVKCDVKSDSFKFVNCNDDLMGIANNKVIYYFYGYNGKVIQLSNGHLIVSNGRVNNDGSYVGFSEIDMLGRIYNEYIISNGYKNVIHVMDNGDYLISSDDVILIDKQNGEVLKRFKVSCDVVNINYDNNEVIVSCSDKDIFFDYKKMSVIKEEEKDNKINISNSNISIGNFYNKYNQNRYGEGVESNSNKGIFSFLLYKSKDKKYKNCDVKFKQEFDRIIVNKSCKDDIYLILDKFMDKRMYKINKDIFYINKKGLKGEYIIYIKIGDDVYKSGYYVKI